MPHIGHRVDNFVVWPEGVPFDEEPEAFERFVRTLPEAIRLHLGGPTRHGQFWHLSLFHHSGGMNHPHRDGFERLLELLRTAFGEDNVEYVRLEFGGDTDGTIVWDSTWPPRAPTRYGDY